jgi:hypothetical protein
MAGPGRLMPPKRVALWKRTKTESNGLQREARAAGAAAFKLRNSASNLGGAFSQPHAKSS